MAIRLEMVCDIQTAEDCAISRTAASPRQVCSDGSQMGVVRAYQQLVNLAYSQGWVRTGHLMACPACTRPATVPRDMPVVEEGPAPTAGPAATPDDPTEQHPEPSPPVSRRGRPRSVDKIGQDLSSASSVETSPDSSASSSHGGS